MLSKCGRKQQFLRLWSDQKRCVSEATFEVPPYKLYELNQGPDTKVKITKGEAEKYYHQMALLRKFESVCASFYTAKNIRGFCHLYTGQEACGVGVKAAMRPRDTVITSYRSHAWCWLQGASTSSILSELTGRVTGGSRGKGGSMHLYSVDFFGGNGIVGSQVPMGTGIGLCHKYKKDGMVSIVLYGDGAANQGQVHESFNMAKLWDLPIVFVCENNKYGMGTSVSRSSASFDYYKRGCYIPGIWVDGMEVMAVREAARFALAHAITKGPIVMELETYRLYWFIYKSEATNIGVGMGYGGSMENFIISVDDESNSERYVKIDSHSEEYFGHSMSDPGTTYRTRSEIQEVREKRDPIKHFKDKMYNANLISEDDIKKIDKLINTEIHDATEKALKDPETPIEELTCDIYKKSLAKNIRGVLPWKTMLHKNFGKEIISSK